MVKIVSKRNKPAIGFVIKIDQLPPEEILKARLNEISNIGPRKKAITIGAKGKFPFRKK